MNGKNILIGLLCCLNAPLVFGQQDGGYDSRLFSQEADSARRVSFNALDYVHQKRHRQDYSLYSDRTLWDNMSVSLYGGLNGIFPREAEKIECGYGFGLSLSKFFSAYNGLRIGGELSKARREKDNVMLGMGGVYADHLFNLSSYLYGFRPYRRFEIISAQGIGANFSSLAGRKDKSFDAHWGLMFRVNLGNHLDIYVEPQIAVYTDGADLYTNWRRYDLGYSAMFGASYRMGRTYRMPGAEPLPPMMENTFISFGSGVRSQLSGHTAAMGFGRAMGNEISLSAGKWFLDPLGIRMALTASYNGWKPSKTDGLDLMSVYAGGRFEFMFNPFMLGGREELPVFSVIPFAGAEVGLAQRQTVTAPISKYIGFSGGLQFKYQASDNLAIYLEPRYSCLNYAFFDNQRNSDMSSPDHLFGLSMGVEVQRWSDRFVRSRVQHSSDDEQFVPHFFMSTGAGAAFPIQQSRNARKRSGYLVNMAFGYRFTPVSALQASGDAGTVFTYMPGEERQVSVTASLDYMLGLTSLIGGYDSNRKWEFDLFAGPVATVVSRDKNRRIYWGLEGGGRLTYKFSDYLGIYAEPKYRLYSSRIYPVLRGTPAIAIFSGGLTYNFAYRDRSYNSTFNNGFFDNFFVGFLGGGTNSYAHTMHYNAGDWLNSLGPEFRLYLGKWLTPAWGVRFTGAGSMYSQSLSRGNTIDQMTAYASISAEGVLNPFRIARPDRTSLVEVLPMAGLEAGVLRRHLTTKSLTNTYYTALTAALQFKFNVADNVAFVVEPRVSRKIYTLPASGKGKNSRPANDNMMSLNFGMEFTNSLLEREIRTGSADFKPYNFVSLGTGVASQLALGRYHNFKLGSETALSVGRKFSTSSALRLNADYMLLTSKLSRTDRNSSTVLALHYMADIANVMGGYDSSRKVSAEFVAGPAVVFSHFNDKQHTTFAFDGGFRGYVNVGSHVDIFAEPKLRFYARNYMPSSFRQAGRLSFSFLLGTSYRF